MLSFKDIHGGEQKKNIVDVGFKASGGVSVLHICQRIISSTHTGTVPFIVL